MFIIFQCNIRDQFIFLDFWIFCVSLKGHMSKVHGAPMRYICNICGKLFSINSDLYKHRKQVEI